MMYMFQKECVMKSDISILIFHSACIILAGIVVAFTDNTLVRIIWWFGTVIFGMHLTFDIFDILELIKQKGKNWKWKYRKRK